MVCVSYPMDSLYSFEYENNIACIAMEIDILQLSLALIHTRKFWIERAIYQASKAAT